VIAAATQRLTAGLFEYQDLGAIQIKGKCGRGLVLGERWPMLNFNQGCRKYNSEPNQGSFGRGNGCFGPKWEIRSAKQHSRMSDAK